MPEHLPSYGEVLAMVEQIRRSLPQDKYLEGFWKTFGSLPKETQRAIIRQCFPEKDKENKG